MKVKVKIKMYNIGILFRIKVYNETTLQHINLEAFDQRGSARSHPRFDLLSQVHVWR